MGLGLAPSTQASANVRVSAPALALLLVRKALKLSGPLWPPSCPPPNCRLRRLLAPRAPQAAEPPLSSRPPRLKLVGASLPAGLPAATRRLIRCVTCRAAVGVCERKGVGYLHAALTLPTSLRPPVPLLQAAEPGGQDAAGGSSAGAHLAMPAARCTAPADDEVSKAAAARCAIAACSSPAPRCRLLPDAVFACLPACLPAHLPASCLPRATLAPDNAGPGLRHGH